jgi:hypothetical protein
MRTLSLVKQLATTKSNHRYWKCRAKLYESIIRRVRQQFCEIDQRPLSVYLKKVLDEADFWKKNELPNH